MAEEIDTGASTVEQLAGRDLNKNGMVINLAISGNSRFYDYDWLIDKLGNWISTNGTPDLIIVGGASGVDFLVEKWAAEHEIPVAVFSEAWNDPREGLEDTGRPEAAPTLVDTMLDHATHALGFPGPKSKWTSIMLRRARERGIPAVEVATPIEDASD